MSDEGGAETGAESGTDSETGDGSTGGGTANGDEKLAPGLSDDGIVLFFVALACLLAATTAHSAGQPLPVVGFAVLAGLPALVAFLADVLTDFVPGTRLEVLVGGAALAGALAAVPGRHYVNLATLLVAAALVLWRVIDVEFRGADR